MSGSSSFLDGIPGRDTAQATAWQAPGLAGPPVLVMGATRRTGTNFLWNVLSSHPRLLPSPIPEDYFLAEAPDLLAYLRAVTSHWSPDWPHGRGAEDELLGRFGGAIQDFLTSRAGAEQIRPGQRLLLKTPDIANLELLQGLFPGARALVVMRDGRDVVASGMRSFGWSFEAGLYHWESRTRRLLEYMEKVGRRHCLVLRFEDVLENPRASLEPVLEFLGLEKDRFDFRVVHSIPVKGSSTLRHESGELSWKPIPRSSDFKPVGRWKEWGQWRKRRFHWVAAETLEAFGYTVPPRYDPRHRARSLKPRDLLGGLGYGLLDHAVAAVFVTHDRLQVRRGSGPVAGARTPFRHRREHKDYSPWLRFR